MRVMAQPLAVGSSLVLLMERRWKPVGAAEGATLGVVIKNFISITFNGLASMQIESLGIRSMIKTYFHTFYYTHTHKTYKMPIDTINVVSALVISYTPP